MRVVMIHAVEESMPPTKLAFQEVFPEAELVNLLDAITGGPSKSPPPMTRSARHLHHTLLHGDGLIA